MTEDVPCAQIFVFRQIILEFVSCLLVFATIDSGICR